MYAYVWEWMTSPQPDWDGAGHKHQLNLECLGHGDSSVRIVVYTLRENWMYEILHIIVQILF